MKVKINNIDLAKVLNTAPGEIIDVKCKNGVPIEREWRNRLKDSAVDNCVSIVKVESKKGDK